MDFTVFSSFREATGGFSGGFDGAVDAYGCAGEGLHSCKKL
jgi:hypothetical protein